MKVMAHRGYSGKYPENTMLAFQKAVEAGCDYVEMDIHESKDGTLVVFHDEKIDRTTDGRGRICDKSFAELRTYNAANLYSGKYAPEKIPAFEEFCEWLSDQRIGANIEIKTDNTYYPDIEEKAWDAIVRCGVEKKVMFSSFNHFSLRRIKKIAGPEIETGALIFWESGVKVYPGEYCKAAGIDCYHAPIEALNDEVVASCKANGIKMNIWTVNDMAGLEKIYDWGCEGIITNYPGVAGAWLKARHE